MLITKKAPKMSAPMMVWLRRCTADGLKTIAQKLVISARRAAPSPTMWNPAGVCCQELATTIHTADRVDPSATSQVRQALRPAADVGVALTG